MKPSNFLILALSVSDLIYGLYLFLYYGVTFSWYPYGEVGCMISVFLEYTYYVSNILLIAISVDRVLFVGLNYTTYMKYQSKKRYQLVVLLCCSVGILMSVIELSLWNYAKKVNDVAANIDFSLYCLYPARRMNNYGLFVSVVYYIIPLFAVTILSVAFMLLLRRRLNQKNRIGCSSTATDSSSKSITVMTVSTAQSTNGREALQSTSTTHSDATIENRKPSDETKTDEEDSKKRYMKPAMTLAALVGSMMLTFFPYCIYAIVTLVRPEIDNSASLIYIMMLVSQMNPGLDPMFYAATQRSIQTFYKRKFDKLLRCCQKIEN